MSNDNITPFPPAAPSRKEIRLEDVEWIGFITKDDRDLYIDNRDDIAKLMAFMSQNKIKVIIGD